MEPSNTSHSSKHALSSPASPTGWEYYLMTRSDSESSTGVPIYRKRAIPIHPRLEYGTLDSLDENQFDAIESLLKERNARTTEDGQWILTELSVAGGSGSFRFRIGFHEYESQTDFQGKFAGSGAVEDEPTVTGNQQPQPIPPSNSNSDDSDSTLTIGLCTSSPSTERNFRASTSVPTPSTSTLPNPVPDTMPSTAQGEPPGSDTRTQEETTMDQLDKIEDIACKLSKLPNGQSNSVEIFSRVLDARKELMGEKHCRTLTTTVNLVYNQLLCGDISPSSDQSEVTTKLWDAYNGLNDALGANDKNAMAALHVLGIAYEHFSDNYHAAVNLFERALKDRMRFLGKNHKDTLETMNCFERVSGKVGWDLYICDFETLLDCQTEVLGKTHEKTLKTMERLAKLYEESGLLVEAEECMKSLLERREAIAGEEDPSVSSCMYCLADICLQRLQF